MLTFLALLSCRDSQTTPEEELDFTPPRASLSGYQRFTVDLSRAGLDATTVDAVTIGGISAWNLEALDADTLVLFDQGAPAPGPQEVVIVADGQEHRFPGALTYDPPLHPAFERVVAFGASLTQGVQGGVPVQHGVLHNPPHLVARSLGAYLPLPLLVDPLFPPLDWSDIGPPPDCVVPSVFGHVGAAAAEVMGVLVDPATGQIDFSRARVDPGLQVHDVAVGDTELHSMIYGPPDDPTELFVVKMVYAPDAAFLEPVTTSQLELIEALQPSLVLSTDPYANDVVQAILLAETLDLGELTPPEQIRADLETLLERLSATGAEIFLANMPDPTVLPAVAEKRAAEAAHARQVALASGEDPDLAEAQALAALDAGLTQIRDAALAHNANLAALAQEYPQLHVVDFAGAVEVLSRDGLVVAGQTLTVSKFGGLLSTDGVHFGDVGYGVVAQLFVDAIEEALDVPLPDVDLEALYAEDPYSPDAARAEGFDPAACRR